MFKISKKFSGLYFGVILLIGFIIWISFADSNTRLDPENKILQHNEFFFDFAANSGKGEVR